MQQAKLAVDGSKECTKCGGTKPVEAFARNRRRPDGLCTWCSSCAAVTTRAWAQRNKDKRREATKRRRAVSAEAVEREQQRYKAKHRTEYLTRARLDASARRAKLRGVFVEHVDPLLVLEREDGACGICGDDVDPLAFAVDHVIPISRGGEHSYANTQAAHPSCNSRKHNHI